MSSRIAAIDAEGRVPEKGTFTTPDIGGNATSRETGDPVANAL